MVPARVRVVLAAAIAALIAPLLPALPAVEPLSAAGLLITVQQVLIGVALGFCLQLTFDAVTLGGQMLANSMGLSFALNMDPQRGGNSSTPALGQLFTLLVMLTFLALNGHLTLLRTLVQSFSTLPIAADGLGTAGLQSVVSWGSHLFAGALAIALPGITALLVVHLALRGRQPRSAGTQSVRGRPAGFAAVRPGGDLRRPVRRAGHLHPGTGTGLPHARRPHRSGGVSHGREGPGRYRTINREAA